MIVFTEQKNNKFLRYSKFCKNILIQQYRIESFKGKFFKYQYY